MKNKKNKTRTKAVYLSDGTSLAHIIDQVSKDGVTDLSTVKYEHEYEGCCGGHHEGEYCYCSPSYSEMRFVYEVKT